MRALQALKAIWLNILALATLAGGVVLFFVDPVKSWTGEHGRVGWTVAVACAAACLALLNLWISASEERGMGAEAESLKAQLTSLDSQLRREKEAHRVALNQIEELQQEPTRRDSEMFEAVLSSFPLDGDLATWMRLVFNGKKWTVKQLNGIWGIQKVVDAYPIVDDEKVKSARDRLMEAMDALQTWMALNGEGVDEFNRTKDVADPTWTYMLHSNLQYREEWPDSRRPVDKKDGRRLEDKVRDQGESLAADILAKREEFEKVGRLRRL